MTRKSKLQLLRDEAGEILKKDPKDFSIRSCWKCNPGHERLKHVDYIVLCSECGHWYYKGEDISE